MGPQYLISTYLDRRSLKTDGTYPIKLRVYSKSESKQILLRTGFSTTSSTFDKLKSGNKLSHKEKQLRHNINRLEVEAHDIAETLTPFSLKRFKSRWSGESKSSIELIAELKTIVKEKLSLGAVSTAEKYSLTIKALLRHNTTSENLTIYDIDKAFLTQFQNHMVSVEELSQATAAIYLRNIRTAYRRIAEGLSLDPGLYPFGNKKNQFQIKSVSKTNKALSEEEKIKLEKSEPKNNGQELAKDFWFFSYFSYGMNLRDILELKKKDLHSEYLSYIRTKTRTTKNTITEKRVPITKWHLKVLEQYKGNDKKYALNFLSSQMTPEEKHRRVKRLNKFINHHIKELALSAGLEAETSNRIAMNHARHTFATLAVRKGTSVAFISEILHDGNLKTTQEYIGSFSASDYKELSSLL
ncbi:site-specific integrase [bacterium]|nr:site-specific integrase [bacterium]